MAELHVRGESQGLGHGDVAERLEQHHCEWAARHPVADNQLGDDIESNLLVRDSLNHTDWNGVDKRNQEGDDKGVDGELGIPNFKGDDREREHGDCTEGRGLGLLPEKHTVELTEDDAIPPLWHLLVLAHQAGMNVGLLG